MAGRPPSYITQEWSVHAQLTISHQPAAVTTTATSPDDGGVRMEYSWAPGGAGPRPCYGFQRGNIVFTTRPSGETPGVYGSLPSRRPAQPYNRRCRSTCNITLSTDHLREGSPLTTTGEGCEVCGGERSPLAARRASNYTTHFCTRLPDKAASRLSQDVASQTHESGTQDVCKSQETQTQAVAGDKAQHTQENDKSLQTPSRVIVGGNYKAQQTPVQTQQARRNDKVQQTPLQTQQSRGNGNVQQTPVQTQQSRGNDKAQNTPLETQQSRGNDDKVQQTQGSDKGQQTEARAERDNSGQSRETQTEAVRRDSDKSEGGCQQGPSGGDQLQGGGEDTPTTKSAKRLARSPARLSGKAPRIVSRKSSSHSPESARQKNPGHKPRTVHIDVYCTGSDASDSSSTSSSDSEAEASWSSPQTVFESEKVRVTHTQVGKDRLPLALMKTTGSEPRQSQSLKTSSSREENLARGYDSDDGLSSHYPSRFSSYTSFQDSATSRDPSSSTISSSSCALSDSFDSITATSWKDTVTDVESLLQSNPSLAHTDSFDYADSIDRLRIRERERAWAARVESKTWRSPQSERRHMIQQQRLREFLEKRLSQGSFPLWKAGKSEESEDDGDETGDAWSFGGGSSPRVSTLKREDTVRKATPSTLTTQPPSSDERVKDAGKELVPPTVEFDSLSDTSPHVPLRRAIFPFISRSPSPMPSKVESSITSPFAARVGLRTDQLSKAERFGTIVGAFRKPGHHIGPSKNPECSCAHCRNFFFEQNECRGRTRSLDMSLEAADNWKVQLQKQIAEKKNVALRGKSEGNLEELRNYEDQWDDSNAV